MIKIKRVSKNWFIPVLTVIPLVFFMVLSMASDEPVDAVSEESQQCLKCHGEVHYTLSDSVSGDEVKLKMYDELQIDAVAYSKGTHGKFKCTDCHSTDYETTPHPVSVKFETNYTCLDCHGGDEAYASFNFEAIDVQYSESVHAKVLGDEFNCWSCHDPHTFKSTKDMSITDKVAHSNEMCLQCHGNEIKYTQLNSKELPNLIEKHDWLPNQALHFNKVRCIDCHASQNDTVRVAHLINPAKQAVKNCVECHSTNSILMASLYKHEVSEQRSELGFYNGTIMNQAYIIGAHRNIYLNIASIAIFGLTLVAIAIHAFFRSRKSTKHATK